MFKFFRKYNKWILAVGVSLLMVAFLIQGTLDRFMGHRRESLPIGRVDGRKITLAQLDQAGSELYILEVLRVLPVRFDRNESLGWLLATLDAQAMGIEVSDRQANELLGRIVGDEAGLNRLANRLRVQPGTIRYAVARWLMVEEYETLVRGLHAPSPVQRMALTARAGELQNQAMDILNRAMQAPQGQGLSEQDRQTYLRNVQEVRDLQRQLTPSPRLSRALMQRFIYDWGATVRVTAVPLDAERFTDQVAASEETDLAELFEQYRNDLPGRGRPYGLGYRRPDAVKVEYLELPFERLLAAVRVEEADALAHFQENKARYMQGEDDDAQPLPYSRARPMVLQELKNQRAKELGERVVKEIQGLLLDDARRLPEVAGYRVVRADWQPMPLSEVAAQVQERFGVLPNVQRFDAGWLDRAALERLAGIGAAKIDTGGREAVRAAVSFPAYAMAARELVEGRENPFPTLRLQTRMPSLAMIDSQDTRYVFRLIDARPEHSPQVLDEVREHVERDARRVAAYRKRLLADNDNWLARLRTSGPEVLAADLATTPLRSEPFPRRVIQGDKLDVPAIPGFGPRHSFTDVEFVDRIFDIVQEIGAIGTLEAVELAQRTMAHGVDQQLSLYLVAVEEFKPISQAEYQQMLDSDPQIPLAIAHVLTDGLSSRPLDVDAVKARVGFVGEHDGNDQSQPETTAPPAAPGT